MHPEDIQRGFRAVALSPPPRGGKLAGPPET
jgi:hypothetical protein